MNELKFCEVFTKFFFKQILKVSAFYLEKQKNIFLAVFSKHAKVIPKDGASRLNFPEGFGGNYYEECCFIKVKIRDKTMEIKGL